MADGTHIDLGHAMITMVEPTRDQRPSATAVLACIIVPFHSNTRTPASSSGR